MPDPQLWAVCGKPVIHSRSPEIFNSLFDHVGLNAYYVRLAADSAQDALDTADAMQLSGLNVTSPFKSEMASLLDELGPQAEALSAVNTVTFKGGTARGVNTDGEGVVSALRSHGLEISNLHVVVLGAGGAARAAVYGLLKNGASQVIVVNRTRERAQEVSRQLGCDWAPAEVLPEVLKKSAALISCIPSGITMVDPAWLHSELTVLDADYRDLRLVQTAEQQGSRVVSGLAWLLGQALPGFRYFTGQDVPDQLVSKLLENLNRITSDSPKSLVMTGFMGSGKTTVGKLLAAKLGWDFLDTDEMLEDRAGLEIPEIFSSLGAESFRRLERSVIRSLPEDPIPRVIALGGGALMDPENRDVLRQGFMKFWLWVSPRNVLKRIDSVTRPLLRNSDGEGLASNLLKERIPGYAESSDLVLNTDDCSAEDITRRILHEMDPTL